jgi:hypothetical protein
MESINYQRAAKCSQLFMGIIIAAIVAIVVLPSTAHNGISLVVFIAYAVVAYHWAEALNKNAVMWAVIGIIPLVGFIALCILANQTSKIFKANGLKLGFFGEQVVPTTDDVKVRTTDHTKASRCLGAYGGLLLIAGVWSEFATLNTAVIIIGCIALAITSYYWAEALKKNKVLWFTLALIPVVNIITYFLLWRHTDNTFKADGGKYGFWGNVETPPKSEDKKPNKL